MSLKQEIESWVEALSHYDVQDYEKALEVFEQNADTSKIYFNVGMIHATLGEHERAVEAYQRATKLDSFLAVAYFQMGVSNFLLGEFAEAMTNFNDALLYLRGNTLIDYEQLGLKFKLYSCEVLFNRGLCYIYDEQHELGMKDLEYAAKEKQVEDHNVIDDAIREQAEGYTVFSVGVGVLYRPNESKVRNVATKDYLGKARLVAASDAQNAFTGFHGAEVKRQEMTQTAAQDDRSPSEISFAASNLVKKDLVSRRDDADAKDRGGFPPTPPPENEFTPGKPVRANTVAAPGRETSGRETPGMQGGRSTSIRDQERRDQSQSRAGSERGDRGDPRGLEPGYGPPRRAQTSAVPEPRRAYSARNAPPSTSSRSGSIRGDRPPMRDLERDRSQIREPHREQSRRRNDYADEIESNPYNDDLYDMYGSERREPSVAPNRRGPGSVRRQQSTRRYDDDEYASDAYEGSSFDEEEAFEMLDSRSVRSGSSRRPDVKKIKIKAHGEIDTRMIIITTGVDYAEFVRRLQEKFGYQKNVRCKIQDEDGDGMISLSDQEDLDNAISAAKRLARRERSEFGRLEIWVQEVK